MDNKPRAIMLMLVSTLSFAFMSVTLKLVNDIPVFEQILFRNAISLFIAFIMIKKQNVPVFGNRNNQKYLLLRSGLGVTGMICNFYAINHLLLADSSILSRLAPFFVAMFAAIFLHEKLTKRIVFALIGVSIGALFVIKPQFDMDILPALAGIMGALFAAGAYTVVRFLKDLEHPSTIVFYFSLFSFVSMLPLTIPIFIVPTTMQLLLLILTGVFAVIGQYGLTYAYKYAPASEVSIFNHTNIIFSAILGFFFFGEIPDILSIIGGAIIIGIAYTLYYQDKRDTTL